MGNAWVLEPPKGRADPKCPTCRGTGLFVPKGKVHLAAIPCPRCRGAASVHFLPQVPQAPKPASATKAWLRQGLRGKR